MTSPATKKAAATPYILMAGLLMTDVARFLFEKLASTHVTHLDLHGAAFLWGMCRQPLVWWALLLGPLQLWMWTRILARIDLSVAYPISGLNMPLTVIAATLLLGEHLSWQVWAGAVLITVGGAILGPGSKDKHSPPGAYGKI
jgi:drug/metabolite transporter (DMT)-like permease